MTGARRVPSMAGLNAYTQDETAGSFHMSVNPYTQDLGPNAANFVPMTPMSF